MNQERELGWNDSIPADADEFTLLPEGEYAFQVETFERTRFKGSSKLPPCNQARVHILINGTIIKHNFFLHTKCAGLICAFFKAIGAPEANGKIQVDWNKILGATGRCKVSIRKWKGDDGVDRENNEITRFLPPPPLSPNAGTQEQEQIKDDLPF